MTCIGDNVRGFIYGCIYIYYMRYTTNNCPAFFDVCVTEEKGMRIPNGILFVGDNEVLKDVVSVFGCMDFPKS